MLEATFYWMLITTGAIILLAFSWQFLHDWQKQARDAPRYWLRYRGFPGAIHLIADIAWMLVATGWLVALTGALVCIRAITVLIGEPADTLWSERQAQAVVRMNVLSEEFRTRMKDILDEAVETIRRIDQELARRNDEPEDQLELPFPDEHRSFHG